MKKAKNTHRRNKNIFKIVSLSLFSVLFVGLITGLAVDWRFPSWIFIAGSSTMQTLLEDISKIYNKAEISSNAGGSSFGLQSVVNGTKNIGSLSKMPSVTQVGFPNSTQPLPEYNAAWNEFGMKTITIGKDAIGIIYKSDVELIINNNNIQTLYSIFAGYKKFTISDLNPNITNSNLEFVPFARSGGARESGTAEAFLVENKLSNGQPDALELIPANNDISVWDALHNGQYGSNVNQTNESNLETWEVMNTYNGPGIPITYLSAGFIINNLSIIQRSGFKIALFAPDNQNTYPLIDDNNEINPNYSWYRPLNLITRTKSNSQYKVVQTFIEWLICNLLFPTSKLNKIYDNIGFISLDAKTIRTMFADNSSIIDEITNYIISHPNQSYDDFILQNPNLDWQYFWVSDFDLYLLQKDERDVTKVYYGAMFE